MIHQVLVGYRERHPGWTYLRLEDIARDPLRRFEELYARLGQTMNREARATIEAHSDASNPSEVSDPAALQRDSLSSISTWKARLTDDEVHAIRNAVEPISKEFYADEDW